MAKHSYRSLPAFIIQNLSGNVNSTICDCLEMLLKSEKIVIFRLVGGILNFSPPMNKYTEPGLKTVRDSC